MYKEMTVLPLITQIKTIFKFEIVDFAIMNDAGFQYIHSDLIVENAFSVLSMATTLKSSSQSYTEFTIGDKDAILFFDDNDAFFAIVFYDEKYIDKPPLDEMHRRLSEVAFFSDHIDVKMSKYNHDHEYAIIGLDEQGKVLSKNLYGEKLFGQTWSCLEDLKTITSNAEVTISWFQKVLRGEHVSGTQLMFLDGKVFHAHCIIDRETNLNQLILSHSPTPAFFYSFLESFDYLRLGVVHFELQLDEQGQPKDAQVLYANERYGAMMGISVFDVIGKTIYEIYPEFSKERFERYARVALKGTRNSFEDYIFAYDKYFHVHTFSSSKNGFVNVYYETTHYHRLKTTEKTQFRKMQMMLTLAEMGFFEIDLEHKEIIGDDFVQTMFGQETIDYTIYRDFFKHRLHPDDKHRVFEENHRLMSGAVKEGTTIFRMALDNGKPYTYIEYYIQTIKSDASGRPQKILGLMRDVTDVQEYQEKLTYMADHDHLSGLYNRHHLYQQLKRDDFSYPFTIAMLDLDGLKTVNDIFGHYEGDKVIQEFSAILKDVFSSSYIARIGGDEFLIILNQDVSNLKTCEKDIRSRLNKIYEFSLPLGVSIGYATVSNSADDINSVIAKAESIMYRQKLLERPKRKQKTLDSLQQYLYRNEPEIKHRIQKLYKLGLGILKRHGYVRRNELDELKQTIKVHAIGKIIYYLHGTAIPSDGCSYTALNIEDGFKILSSLIEKESIAKAILHQCEHYDGQGKPLGLKGDDIPLHSRILNIILYYIDLIEPNGEHKALSAQQVLSLMKPLSGEQFDPVLFESFVKLF